MSKTITNMATLNYTSNTDARKASSNTASITLQGPLEVAKHALETAYKIGDEVTYNVFISNTSQSPITALTIMDDLGTYPHGGKNITPLTYVGPAKLFINDVFSKTLDETAEAGKVSFTIESVAAGSKAMVQYKAKINEYAGAEVGTAKIINTASANAAGFNDPIAATHELPIGSYAEVMVEKTMTPDPVIDGGVLTYTFDMKNYGTIAATNVSLEDTFVPAPNITSVLIDGAEAAEGSYSYEDGRFLYPAADAAGVTYSIDEAAFRQDAETGAVTITPGASRIVITGTI